MLQNNGIMIGNVVNINRKVMTNFLLLLTLHYEDVADFTQSWSSNKKSVHSIFVLNLGVKKDQNWMTEVGRLAHCICRRSTAM